MFTRPHLLFFLMEEDVDELVEHQFSPVQVEALRNVAKYLMSRAKLLYLDDVQAARLSWLAY